MTQRALSRITFRPSRVEDVYALARELRDEDRSEIAHFGIDPRRALRSTYAQAVLSRTYFVDGEIAAMGGVCGAIVNPIGFPFLMTTPAVLRVRVAFVRECEAMVARMLALRDHLVGDVDASYTGAIRLLEHLGFEIGDARLVARDGQVYRSFTLSRKD